MTMKWNIKLVMENYTNEMTIRQSLPVRMYFNFLSRLTKILKFYFLLILHTFASRTMPAHSPKLAKECNFNNTSLNSNFL